VKPSALLGQSTGWWPSGGLPMTALGFYQVQVHVDCNSWKASTVPTC
jgi:hypothetical protein